MLIPMQITTRQRRIWKTRNHPTSLDLVSLTLLPSKKIACISIHPYQKMSAEDAPKTTTTKVSGRNQSYKFATVFNTYTTIPVMILRRIRTLKTFKPSKKSSPSEMLSLFSWKTVCILCVWNKATRSIPSRFIVLLSKKKTGGVKACVSIISDHERFFPAQKKL